MEDSKADGTVGRWTKLEHENFLRGLRDFGKDWKRIGQLIQTRTVVQVRTHAQKYFLASNKKHHDKSTPSIAASPPLDKLPRTAPRKSSKRSSSSSSAGGLGKRKRSSSSSPSLSAALSLDVVEPVSPLLTGVVPLDDDAVEFKSLQLDLMPALADNFSLGSDSPHSASSSSPSTEDLMSSSPETVVEDDEEVSSLTTTGAEDEEELIIDAENVPRFNIDNLLQKWNNALEDPQQQLVDIMEGESALSSGWESE